MSALSPFARLMNTRAEASSSRRLAPAIKNPTQTALHQTASPGGRAAKGASGRGEKVGTVGSARRLSPANFLHLNTPPQVERALMTSVASCAAAILDLPEAKQHPATAARLAADPSVSLASARAVLQSIAPAAAAAANAKHGPFVVDMMRVRGLIDGKVHAAAPRDPTLAVSDNHNARAARIETAGLSEADRAEFARAWSRRRGAAA